MAIRPIIKLPDPRLKLVSDAIPVIDESVRTLAADMLETMYDAPGIGLAAIQIGVPKRVIVIDVSGKDEPKAPMILINARLVSASDEMSVYEEGCLSIPDYYAEVERPARVTVSYLDEHGAERRIEAEGLLATCLQHEIDHTNGINFIDHLSKLKRDRVIKKFTKAAKLEQPAAEPAPHRSMAG
ncbi:MAG: peptide deformylase [Beijerinckiaceae bacterium]|nr:peptide deformylase [Beijerinckiaceae bacterium]